MGGERADEHEARDEEEVSKGEGDEGDEGEDGAKLAERTQLGAEKGEDLGQG